MNNLNKSIDMKNQDRILLGHGSGGKLSYNLLSDLFLKYFKNEELGKLNDAARLKFPGESLVFSTDSYVVDPIFFSGGNIGKLAVCGTVNDVAMMGAKPLFLSVGFIIEEGLSFTDLEMILESMRSSAEEADVQIVTGDTKVVPKGAADKIFINTAGVGVPYTGINLSGHDAQVGDKIIINGMIADHGITVMARREGLEIDLDLKTDSAPLNHMIKEILDKTPDIHVMRDPTRGGIATTLNEISRQSQVGIKLTEKDIPVSPQVNAVCEILGLDPFYIANEGKVLVFSPADYAEDVLTVMRANKYGQMACIIGEVEGEHKGKVYLDTVIGGQRMMDMLAGEQLPRIC
jgi:hydrogenase expression/formation protein HypE